MLPHVEGLPSTFNPMQLPSVEKISEQRLNTLSRTPASLGARRKIYFRRRLAPVIPNPLSECLNCIWPLTHNGNNSNNMNNPNLLRRKFISNIDTSTIVHNSKNNMNTYTIIFCCYYCQYHHHYHYYSLDSSFHVAGRRNPEKIQGHGLPGRLHRLWRLRMRAGECLWSLPKDHCLLLEQQQHRFLGCCYGT